MPNFNAHTTSGLSTHLMAYLEKKFLERLKKTTHFDKFAKKKKLGKNLGSTVKWHRWANPAASTTALTESESPDGISLSSTSVTATIAGYGQFAATSDFLNATAINDQMDDMVDLLGYAGGLSIDTLYRNEVDANATVQYADSGQNSSEANVASNTDEFIAAEVRKATKTLRTADVPEFEDGMYRGIIHPFAEYSLLSETAANTLVVAQSMTDRSSLERAEVGKLYGVKFFRSSNIRASTATVYRNIITGVDAYAGVDLEGMGLEIIVKPLGSAGTEDPLNQRATVGYKFYFATKILEAARVIRVSAYGA
jgi:N4-gp56 family major capsid protein